MIEKELIDESFQKTLRPQYFKELVGQKDLVEKLSIAVEAAKVRDEPPTSTLLSGPPGTGKSTIAYIMANEYGTECKTIMGPSVKSPIDLLGILIKLENKDFLLIDEIDAVSAKSCEILHSAIDEFKITRKIDQKQIVHLNINPFCLVATTNFIHKVPEALRGRFGIIHTLSLYNEDELFAILAANFSKLNILPQNDDIVSQLARRSRGIPRLGNRLLYRCYDLLTVENTNILTQEFLDQTMDLEGINDDGLTNLDLQYMGVLYNNFGLAPTGIKAISGVLNQNESYIEQVCEPYLVNKNFITKTKSGRVLTQNGIEYLNSLN